LVVNVLVVTDGKLEPGQVVSYVAPLAGNGSVTVMTVTEIPRALLRDLRSDFGEHPAPSVASDAEYVGVSGGGSEPAINYPGDDAIIAQYLGNRDTDVCGPLIDALAAAGVSCTSESLESENAAATLISEIRSRDIGLVVIGSHGQGRFEGLLGSTGTKVARLSAVPVLLLRSDT
jgi:nucleotide-binding universal stress UspA family protein